MATGFLATIGGGMAPAFSNVSAEYSAGTGIAGFIFFIIGAELYIRTRKSPFRSNVSNTAD